MHTFYDSAEDDTLAIHVRKWTRCSNVKLTFVCVCKSISSAHTDQSWSIMFELETLIFKFTILVDRITIEILVVLFSSEVASLDKLTWNNSVE